MAGAPSKPSPGEPVRIVLTRSTPLLALVALATTGLLWAIPGYSLLSGTFSAAELAVFGAFTAVLALPFVWTVWRMPKTLRGTGIEIDSVGIHPFDGRPVGTITWSEIAGIGFGSGARSRRGRKRATVPALEIYLKQADRPPPHRRIRADWHVVDAPADAHSHGCLRFAVSPFGQDADRIERAVRRYRPELWGGPFIHDLPNPGRAG
jgi:hypothetical protein